VDREHYETISRGFPFSHTEPTPGFPEHYACVRVIVAKAANPPGLILINGGLRLRPSYRTANQFVFYTCGHTRIVNEILRP